MTPQPESASIPTERRIEQATAFDHIGERYDEAFPTKRGSWRRATG